MRAYITAYDEAVAAVAEIVRLVNSGEVEPLVGFDVETAPIRGLSGYPGTQFDDAGEPIAPNKRQYQEFTRRLWQTSFNPTALQRLGIAVPLKDNGAVAKAAWFEFYKQVKATPDSALEAARWAAGALYDHRCQLAEAALAAEQRVADLFGVKGRVKELRAAEKQSRAAAEAKEALGALVPQIEERIEHPVDLRILRHLVAVTVEGRIKVDPVRPGLDPYTSDLSVVQITLRRPGGELLSWAFNTIKIGDVSVLTPLMKLRNATYIGANIKFDLGMALRHFGVAPWRVYCTRVASRMLYLGLNMSHSLAACAKRYAGIELSKEARSLFVGRRSEELTPEQIEYVFLDTEVLFPIYDRQLEVAKQRNAERVITEFSRLSYVTALWEYEGFTIDVEKWRSIAREAARKRDEQAAELEKMLLPPGYAELLGADVVTAENEDGYNEDCEDEDGGEDNRKNAIIRISQRALVAERLSEVLGLPVVSLQKEARGLLEARYREINGGETHPFFRAYMLWSKFSQQAKAFGEKFLWNLHPLSGRVHPTFTIAGADTGRYSSTRPNTLNIPAGKEEGDPDYRSAFLAPEGFYLIGADYESMELRIMGDRTRDPVVKRMVSSGGDPHAFTAAMMFHIRSAAVEAPRKVKDTFRYGTSTFTIDVFEVPQRWAPSEVAEFALTDEVQGAVGAVPKRTTRTVAKSVTFLWLFRGGPFTLAQRTGLPEEQCEAFFARFNEVYSQMAVGMDQVAESVFENYIEADDGIRYAYSEAYGGLRRWFQMPHNPSRREYPSGWAGELQFKEAQRQYRRELNAIKREACNLPAQGSNAFITARALNLIIERGRPLGIRPFLSIYDEIILLVPDRVPVEAAKVILESSMLDPADEFMQYIPAGAEAGKPSKYWIKS